ncbi:MAG: peptidylprolyl isomerase [Spirochaetales bacterium]|nr:peptidylprolyl isomerase [Spirochaetales bacterium]
MRNKVPAKTRLFILLLLPACVGAVFAAGTKQISAVASVNGVLIPKAYLEREVRRFEEQALGQGQSLDENRKAQISREALDTLIDMELLYQESQRRGFQVSEQRIQEQVDRLREQFEGEEGYAAALEQIGISDGELRTELGRQLAIQEMIDRDIVPSTTVSEQESIEFYESNPEFFFSPEQVRASHILIRVSPEAGEEEKSEARSRIAEIRERIVAGEDFAELAGRFSDDGSSAAGGDLGFFQREQMVEPFAEAAFSLQIGQLSRIVETQFGFHLIQVTDRQDESVVPYETVQPRIFQYLQREKAMVTIEELAAELRGRAEIEEYGG